MDVVYELFDEVENVSAGVFSTLKHANDACAKLVMSDRAKYQDDIANKGRLKVAIRARRMNMLNDLRTIQLLRYEVCTQLLEDIE